VGVTVAIKSPPLNAGWVIIGLVPTRNTKAHESMATPRFEGADGLAARVLELEDLASRMNATMMVRVSGVI
jgi:hypothetical protein